MRALLGGELHKLRSTRLLWGFLLGTLAIAMLGTLLNISVFGKLLPGVSLGSSTGLLVLLANGAAGTSLALVLGVAGVTTEYRHGTIAPTFLVTPRRERVVVAKVLVHALAGVVLGVVGVATAAAGAFGWLAFHRIPMAVAPAEIATFLFGVIVATALSGAFGAGLGWVLKGPVVALVLALVVEPVIEPLVGEWLPGVGRYLPTAVLGTVAGHPGPQALSRWAGAGVYLLYVLALTGGGAYLARRRDAS